MLWTFSVLTMKFGFQTSIFLTLFMATFLENCVTLKVFSRRDFEYQQHHPVPNPYHIFIPKQFKDDQSTDEQNHVNTMVDNAGMHLSQVYFSIEFYHKKYKLRLLLNEGLLPANFAKTTVHANRSKKIHKPSLQELDHCYYHGEVVGENDSFVMMSTCNGLRGCILLKDDVLLIEPLHQRKQEQAGNLHHVAYKMTDMMQPSGSCGNAGGSSQDLIGIFKMMKQHKIEEEKRVIRLKRNGPTRKKFIELLLVADKDETEKYDETTLDTRLKEVANYIDGYYRQLGMRVILSHIETWKTENEIDFSLTNPHLTLWRFLIYRYVRFRVDPKTSPWFYADNVQLVSGNPIGIGVLGMASDRTMCSTRAGGLNYDSHKHPLFTAATVAHEMGHNFGLDHDKPICSCPSGFHCIMETHAVATTSKTWSSCSKISLAQNLKLGLDVCLYNIPLPNRIYGGPQCGNDIIELGEECDCGLPEDCTSACCNSTSCQLFAGARCDAGACCVACNFSENGTVCRETAGNFCDLSEYCTGTSAYCPINVFKENGTPCLENEAYCYQGTCLTHDGQCQNIWGSNAASGDYLCFALINIDGKLNGNCGTTGEGSYKKCDPSDVMCGNLQCAGGKDYPLVNFLSFFTATLFMPDREIECRVLSSSSKAKDVSDPALVRDGTRCGDGKVCYDAECIRVAETACLNSCNGHGVCDNMGDCHCEPGWAPPNCTAEGSDESVVNDSLPSNISGATDFTDNVVVNVTQTVPKSVTQNDTVSVTSSGTVSLTQSGAAGVTQSGDASMTQSRPVSLAESSNASATDNEVFIADDSFPTISDGSESPHTSSGSEATVAFFVVLLTTIGVGAILWWKYLGGRNFIQTFRQRQ